jgi:hypothetical protein
MDLTKITDDSEPSWWHKVAGEMSDDEVNDARAYYADRGENWMEGEWLRRHGLPEDYGFPQD